MRFHRAPFQCRITVWPKLEAPTAQAFFAEVAATPPSEYVCPAMAGLATRLHLLPFRCQIRESS